MRKYKKKLAFAAIFACLAACRERESAKASLTESRQQSECEESPNDPSGAPNYYQLKATALTNPSIFKDKESFLENLPKSFRSNFVLFHETRSRDVATFAQPRLVFFSDVDRPLTFLATDGSTTNQRIEMIEFVEKSNRFCFHEILLGSNAALKFNDHPASCAGCHNRDSRPNWESYNTWPRLYGSRDGFMSKGSIEETGFKSFIAQNRDKGVYKSLVAPNGLLVDEDHNLIRFVNESKGQKTSPTSRLTTGLVRLNNRRIARILLELVKEPAYSRYAQAIQGALLGCDQIENFVPNNLKPNHPKRYQDVLAETKSLIKASHEQLDLKISTINTSRRNQIAEGRLDLNIPKNLQAIANLRYLLENRKEGSVVFDDWSMSFLKTYHFAAEGAGITDVAAIFSAATSGVTNNLELMTCSQLQATSSQL